jgi:CRP/FNR family cyclic AMP-dependent transcriptional regulator
VGNRTIRYRDNEPVDRPEAALQLGEVRIVRRNNLGRGGNGGQEGGGGTKASRTGRGGPDEKAGATLLPQFDGRSFLSSVGMGRTSTAYQTKQIVYRQGDPADAVHYIQAGKVRLTVVSEQGKEGVIAMLGAGEFFGEGCIAMQPLRMASAATMVKSTIVRIEKAAMLRVLHEQPAMSEMFMSFLLSRNIQIEADLVDHLFNSSERRLARLLLLLANYGKEGTMESVIPSINQDVLAARVGTTRSRISYFMNKFRKLGFIEYNGGLKFHSSLLNVVVHD